jgi:hypothetical protein
LTRFSVLIELAPVLGRAASIEGVPMPVSPNIPTPKEYVRLLKERRKPSQAPVLKGTLVKPTVSDLARLRKATHKPTQAPVLKGTITKLTAAEYVRVRKSLKAPTQAKVGKTVK